MLENKSMKVSVSQEQLYIDRMAWFGWNVKSSQEINSRESHLETRGDDVYSVTTKENYIKLLFERAVPKNKRQLDALENEMHSIMNNYPSIKPWELLVSFIGLFIYIVPGVVFFLWRKRVAFKKMDEANARIAEIHKAAISLR